MTKLKFEKDFGRKIKVDFLSGRPSLEMVYELNNKTINVLQSIQTLILIRHNFQLMICFS